MIGKVYLHTLSPMFTSLIFIGPDGVWMTADAGKHEPAAEGGPWLPGVSCGCEEVDGGEGGSPDELGGDGLIEGGERGDGGNGGGGDGSGGDGGMGHVCADPQVHDCMPFGHPRKLEGSDGQQAFGLISMKLAEFV